GRAAADDAAAQAVIDKAIKAHGGLENLKKHKDSSATVKAKATLYMPVNVEGTMEVFAGNKKFKHVFQFTIMGTDVNQVTVYDGKEFWVSVNNKIVLETKDDKDLQAIRDEIRTEELAGLVMLKEKDKGIELSLVGDDKVEGKDVVGVRVSAKDARDITMYFDKETGLLAKVANKTIDFNSKMEVDQEKLMSDYKEFDGMKRPGKITLNREGKKFLEMEIQEVKFVDKFADDTFAKPNQ